MNQRPTGLSATKAITGFLQYKCTEGLTVTRVNKIHRSSVLLYQDVFQRFILSLDLSNCLIYWTPRILSLPKFNGYENRAASGAHNAPTV